MGYIMTKQGDRTNGYITSFQCDTRNDIATLPISPEVKKGSDCIVLEDATVWLLNASGEEWQELGETGTIHGGGGSTSILGTGTFYANGTYNASQQGYDGYSKVIINVPQSGGGSANLGTKTVSENGVYNASDDGFDGYSRFTVDVQAQPDYDIYLSKSDPAASLGSVGDVFVKHIENGVEWISTEAYYVYDKNTLLWSNGTDSSVKKANGTAIAVCLRFSGMGFNDGVAALISTVRENVDIVMNGDATADTFSADIDGVTWYVQRSVAGSYQSDVPFPLVEVSHYRSEFESSETIRAEVISSILNSAHVERTLKGSVVIYTKDNTGWREYSPTGA